MVKSVKVNFAFNSAYQILNILVPLITTPYLSRTIGATGNGLFTYTQSIANYFVLFAQLGISNYGVRAIAECGDDRALRSRTFWDAFAMCLVVGLIVCVAYVGYCFTFGMDNLRISLIWLIWVFGSVIDVTWLLFGCQEFEIPTIRNCVTRLGGMLFIFLFVRSEADTWAYVLAIAAPCLINSILVWPFVCRYVDYVKPTWRGTLVHLMPNLTLFIPVIATSLYTLLDKVMLGAMAGMGQTGLYDYAEKIAKMPMAVITALGAVVLPKMSEVIAAGKIDEGKRLIHMTMWFMEACAFALCFGIIAVAPEFVPTFFGSGYDDCVVLMDVLAVIIPLICATNVLGVQYLLPSHRDTAFTLSVFIGACVNIVFNVFAIPAMGALGAAFGTVLAEVAVLVAQAVIVRRELNLQTYARETFPFIVIGVGMLLLIRLLAGFLGIAGLSSILGLLLEVAAGGAFYLAVSFVYCRVTRNSLFASLFPSFAKPRD